MKTFITILAILVLLFMIPVSLSLHEDYQVYKRGKIVDVTVVSVPTVSVSHGGDMTFLMNGKMYRKRISILDYGFKNGDTIQLKYLEGYDYNFLFPNEKPMLSGMLLIVVMSFVAFYLLYYIYIKKGNLNF